MDENQLKPSDSADFDVWQFIPDGKYRYRVTCCIGKDSIHAVLTRPRVQKGGIRHWMLYCPMLSDAPIQVCASGNTRSYVRDKAKAVMIQSIRRQKNRLIKMLCRLK